MKNNKYKIWDTIQKCLIAGAVVSGVVVGGATIYKLALPYADRLYISYVLGKYEGNKYFPSIDFSKFNLTWENKTEQVRYTLYERVIL